MFSDFFPYITGTDHSQCQKLLIFPNLETKISQFTCQKNRPLSLIIVFFSLKRCTSYFPVLDRKYRSLHCTWSLAYDYSWYLITANIPRERLMHLVLFLLFLLYLSIWHYLYTYKKSQFVWFWCHFFPIEWVPVPVPMGRKKSLMFNTFTNNILSIR